MFLFCHGLVRHLALNAAANNNTFAEIAAT